MMVIQTLKYYAVIKKNIVEDESESKCNYKTIPDFEDFISEKQCKISQ